MTLVSGSRALMESYLEALSSGVGFADYFTDDVIIEIVGSGQTAQGRATVEAMIRYVHEQAFDGRPVVKALTVTDSAGALEADFVARHTGDFAGIAATGRDIRVPYSVHYDFKDGQIAALRIYGLASDLIQKLTA